MACGVFLCGEAQAVGVFLSVGAPGLLRQGFLSLRPQLCAVTVHAGDCGAVLLPVQGVRGLHGVLLGHGLDQHALLYPRLPADGHLCCHDREGGCQGPSSFSMESVFPMGMWNPVPQVSSILSIVSEEMWVWLKAHCPS